MPAETERTTTSNGHEIQRPTERLDAEAYRSLLEKAGLTGESPAERIEQLKTMSAERVAVLLTTINKLAQGSKDHLLNKATAMKIGETPTLAPEYRYDVFMDLIRDIQATPDDVNPSRVADALALGTVLLHPFHDGNGRTARLIGLTFRDSFDKPEEYAADFATVAEPRDEARRRGGFMIYGYVPHLPEGADQSNPRDVSAYLHSLLTSEQADAYVGPYDDIPAPLHMPLERVE